MTRIGTEQTEQSGVRLSIQGSHYFFRICPSYVFECTTQLRSLRRRQLHVQCQTANTNRSPEGTFIPPSQGETITSLFRRISIFISTYWQTKVDSPLTTVGHIFLLRGIRFCVHQIASTILRQSMLHFAILFLHFYIALVFTCAALLTAAHKWNF